MSKVKTKKHSTFIDMTAMSDMTVLLLTFFMLTATFLPKEPVMTIAPSSVVDFKIPDYNLLTILVRPDGMIYVNLDRPNDRRAILEKVAEDYGMSFSDKQILSFMNQAHIGVPISQLPAFLDMGMLDQDSHLKTSGVPTDSINNELMYWVQSAKVINSDLQIAIKADRVTPYPLVNNVISTLQDIRENRFHLITVLEGMPEGF